MDMLYSIAFALVIIGAINWGLVALFKFDLVAALFAGDGKFGNLSNLSRIVYGLVGASAIYVGIMYFYTMM